MALRSVLAITAVLIGACGEDLKCAQSKCGSFDEDRLDASYAMPSGDDGGSANDAACEALSVEECNDHDGCFEVRARRYAVADGQCQLVEEVVSCRTSVLKPAYHCSDGAVELVSCDAAGQVWFSSHDCMPLSHHECTAAEADLNDIYADRCQQG